MQGAGSPPNTSSSGEQKNLFSQPKSDYQEEEEKAKTRPYLHMPRHGAAWMLFLGAIVMFSCLGAPWWSWTLNSTSQSATYYLFIWGVVCLGPSCPGSSTSPLAPPTAPALVAGSFPTNLGNLYGATAALVVIAAVFAIVAAAIMFRVARGLSEYPKAIDRAVLLSYLGLVLALATPIMLSIAQTASFRGDFGFPINMAPSPASSFYGSLGPGTYNHITYSGQEWGPSFSWFLCLLGGGLFFAGGIMPHLTRHEAVTRRDLIRSGLLKLQAPMRRPLPPGVAARGLPAPYPTGGRPYPVAPGRPYPVAPGRPPVPMYAGYGPQYTSLAPGVGWARPPPPVGTTYRPTPALPPPSRPTPVAPYATPQAPTIYRPAPMPPSPAPSAAVYRPQPRPTPTTISAAGPSAPARPTPIPSATTTGRAPPTAAAPGAVLRSTPGTTTPPRPAPPAVTATGNRMCPKCQTYTPPPALRCTKCGTLLPR